VKINIKLMVLLIGASLVMSACTYVPVNDLDPARKIKASNINVQLGIGYLQQNNLEVANQKLNRALIQNPKSATAHNAYGILQERLLQYDVAEKHYKIGAELDVANSQANNNYGAFLCKRGRQAESEKYFLIALKQPLYKTPEFAYTNAGVCMEQIQQDDKAEKYLKKALAARSNFSTALINLAKLYFKQGKNTESLLYLKRFNLVKNSTAKSLWLEARNYLELGNINVANKKIDALKQGFPNSTEYKEWELINQ